MSNRERWIVYPLLFYAVLSCMKTALVEPTDVSYETVTCNHLLLESVEGEPLVQLGAHIDDEGAEWGLIELFDAQGQLAVELAAGPGGGYFTSLGAAAAPTLTLGHDNDARQSGLRARPAATDDSLESGETWGLRVDWSAHVPASESTDSAADADGPNKPAG